MGRSPKKQGGDPTKRKRTWIQGRFHAYKRGAEGQIRTDTGSPPPVFETGASTIFRLLILGVEPEDSLALTIEQTSASSCFGKGLWEYEIEYILGTSATGR